VSPGNTTEQLRQQQQRRRRRQRQHLQVGITQNGKTVQNTHSICSDFPFVASTYFARDSFYPIKLN